ncbi:GNAT family N-acetyltransferase [Clostridium botulinum]|uniref:GNAT family N-acetyltransferase n=1 Tax=Clostridium botulinum TaxID=1491 RepID=UPI0007732C46|nr:GNAT family N-acetyltransferase [Clostridium botulinum]MCS6105305.1 GNAT family N-acetyltransferase [Clostridium botulinum]MCS6108733.1 GNAT family N-acetyltransferase [Clostridium botulinum]NFE73342.1 GNAT family N-acetyltransferase [Clostridium botulinum]NFH80393.1 GNAT family N-acetyltransferase [Clostridium botulinum]NFH83642.1 GNAT family N-acetyltransferase [Clostridium botulinum]
MFIIEKLSLKNLNYFKTLQEEANDKYINNKDFFELYNDKSFITKYIKRREIKLFKYNNKYIGYLWMKYPLSDVIKILSLYVSDYYINFMSKELTNVFKNKTLNFDVVDSNITYDIMTKLNFTRIRSTSLMKMRTSNCSFNFNKDVNFKVFTKKEDENLRCFIQNSVFKDNDRIPLVPYDIKLEEEEDYYINDLCVFIMIGNIAIGYGQVISNKDIYTIVNVGILEEYRKNGYGKMLIQYLIYICYKKHISQITINVDVNNYKALNLYKKIGFNEYGKISTWSNKLK